MLVMSHRLSVTIILERREDGKCFAQVILVINELDLYDKHIQ